MNSQIPYIIVGIGFFIILIGLIWLGANKLGINLGHLPGDIYIKKDNFTFYFPITTTIILSIIVSLLLLIITKIVR